MNVIDLILVLILAAVVFLAVRKLVRDRKSGKTCSCGCSGCTGCAGSSGSGSNGCQAGSADSSAK